MLKQCDFQQRIVDKSIEKNGEDDKQQSKIITRKQIHHNNFHSKFKKKVYQEVEEAPTTKRCHSQAMKFMKTPFKSQNHIQQQETLQPTHTLYSNQQDLTHLKQFTTLDQANAGFTKTKKLVFNKFTKKEQNQIQKMLHFIRTTIQKNINDEEIQFQFNQIVNYLFKLEDNNKKLLEVNYFFQKQFTFLMKEKSILKRTEKCVKNYCVECKYHLQKQNKWKVDRKNLQQTIQKLSLDLEEKYIQMKIIKTQKIQLNNTNTSKNASETECPSEIEYLSSRENQAEQNNNEFALKMNKKHVEEQLREIIKEKVDQYLVLLTELNYLNDLHQEMKIKYNKMSQQLKYVSIQNRTLMTVKTQLIQKELELEKYRIDRNYFKKKALQNYHRLEKMTKESKTCEECKQKIENQQNQNDVFSLSSQSLSNNCSLLEESHIERGGHQP